MTLHCLCAQTSVSGNARSEAVNIWFCLPRPLQHICCSIKMTWIGFVSVCSVETSWRGVWSIWCGCTCVCLCCVSITNSLIPWYSNHISPLKALITGLSRRVTCFKFLISSMYTERPCLQTLTLQSLSAVLILHHVVLNKQLASLVSGIPITNVSLWYHLSSRYPNIKATLCCLFFWTL